MNKPPISNTTIDLCPSILTADFTRLGEQLREAFTAGIKRLHVDVMDGRFVPNISIGPLLVENVRPLCNEFKVLIEAHLMIVEPEKYLADFARSGADLITVHAETCPHLNRTVQQIHELGKLAGVAINPATPLVELEEILSDIELALVMTVNPGFGGQELIPAALEKVPRLRETLARRNLSRVHIQVDGGIHQQTIAAAARAGATLAVTGSAVFNKQASVTDNIRALRAAAGV